MSTVKDVYRALNEWAPFSRQESWDNSGLLIGGWDRVVRRAVLLLDAAPADAERAAQSGADLLITHHPVIFHPLKSVQDGSIAETAVRNGLSILSAHTNLDVAEGGVNDCLAEVLGLGELEPFSIVGTEQTPEGAQVISLGRIGQLPDVVEPKAFAQWVDRQLGGHGLRWCAGTRPVQRVAVCGGAGGSLLGEALQKDVDALVTSEVKQDQWVDACQAGLTLIDGGHYPTEAVVLEPLQKRLAARFPEVEFVVDPQGGDVFRTLISEEEKA